MVSALSGAILRSRGTWPALGDDGERAAPIGGRGAGCGIVGRRGRARASGIFAQSFDAYALALVVDVAGPVAAARAGAPKRALALVDRAAFACRAAPGRPACVRGAQRAPPTAGRAASREAALRAFVVRVVPAVHPLVCTRGASEWRRMVAELRAPFGGLLRLWQRARGSLVRARVGPRSRARGPLSSLGAGRRRGRAGRQFDLARPLPDHQSGAPVGGPFLDWPGLVLGACHGRTVAQSTRRSKRTRCGAKPSRVNAACAAPLNDQEPSSTLGIPSARA